VLLRGSSNGQLPSWFGVPFLLGGLAFLAFGFVLLLDELRLSNEGVTTTAVVVEKDYSPGGGDSGPSYELGYEFAPAGSTTNQHGSSDVSEEMYDATPLGAAVEVTYLPSDPTKSRVGSTDPQLFVSLMVLGGGLVFLVVGGAMLVIVPRMRRRVAEAVAPPKPAPQRPTTEAELRALDARLAAPPRDAAE